MLVWFESFRITGVTDVMPRRFATATAARIALSCLSLCVTMSSRQSPPNVHDDLRRLSNAKPVSGRSWCWVAPLSDAVEVIELNGDVPFDVKIENAVSGSLRSVEYSPSAPAANAGGQSPRTERS